MRRFRRTKTADDSDVINITPMLDIVFIMLIFFIATTSFVRESGVEINRPTAKTAQQQKKSNTILLALKPNGEIWIDKRAVDVRSVSANIERLKVQDPSAGVIIQADENVKTGLLVQVMDQVRQGGVSKISIAAEIE